MRWELRKNRKGQQYYSFLYWDDQNKKRKRLKKTDTAHVKTEKQAEVFAQKWNRKHDAAKYRIKRRMEWREKHHDMAELLDKYIAERKKKAPNSWTNDAYWLEKYCFYFFVENKSLNNLDVWSEHFNAFRDWLEEASSLRSLKGQTREAEGGRVLSYSSKNHCIKSLNTFLRAMVPENLEKFASCPYFSRDLLNRKGIEFYVTEKDAEEVEEKLREIDANSADFFRVLYHTGLRLNEGLGLSLKTLRPGIPEDKTVKKAIERFQMDCFAYLVLESQPASSVAIRDTDGKIKRKPLKGRKKIDLRNNRLIPISDAKSAGILMAAYDRCKSELEKDRYGNSGDDYLLFEGLNKNIFSNNLKKAYLSLKKPYRSPHSLRHSFATNLIGRTDGDPWFTAHVLGHSLRSPEVTMRYNHLWEAIQQKEQVEQKDNWSDARRLIDSALKKA